MVMKSSEATGSRSEAVAKSKDPYSLIPAGAPFEHVFTLSGTNRGAMDLTRIEYRLSQVALLPAPFGTLAARRASP